ncbi:MAG TPA: protein YgfX [Burkholderiales bacterium]|nr:protein YgfX [Burkholderiales bacterium]
MSGTRLALSPSWNLAAAIVALHAAAAAAVWIALPGALGVVLAAALLMLGLAAAWGRALLRSSRSVVAIDVAGRVELRNGASRAIAAGRRHVGRFMVTLPLKGRTVLVTRDMLRVEEFRRLRLWALWGKLPRVAPEQLHFPA